MTDKPFDHEEYSRSRLRQTTPGAGEVCGEAFSETGRGLDGPDYCALPLGHEGPHNSWAKQPGAGEGERWEKQNVKETMAGTIAELHIPSYSKFGWQLPEWLVDLICTLHTERTHLVSRDAYVEMRDAREADQQTIADLRAQVDAAWLTANLNHEKAVAYDIAVEESGSGTYHLRDWVREQAQTIADLQGQVHEYRTMFRKEKKRADSNRADFLEAQQTIAELRKALEEIAATDHEDMNAGYTAWVLSTEALAAIVATEEGA